MGRRRIQDSDLIGTGEASKILGVSTMTIRALMRRGELQGRIEPTHGKHLMLHRKDVEALVPKMLPLAEVDRAIEDLREEHERLRKKLEARNGELMMSLAEAQMKRDARIGWFHNIKSTAGALRQMEDVILLASRFYRNGEEDKRDRDTEIFKMYLRGYSRPDIAEAFDLTEERVRQVVEWKMEGVHELEDLFKRACDSIVDAQVLRGRLALAEYRMADMETTIRQYAEDREGVDLEVVPEAAYLRLDTFPLSTRTKNIIAFQNSFNDDRIVTLGDLSKRSYKDLMRMRGMGRKCADELDLLLRSQGLKLKDNIDDNN